MQSHSTVSKESSLGLLYQAIAKHDLQAVQNIMNSGRLSPLECRSSTIKYYRENQNNIPQTFENVSPLHVACSIENNNNNNNNSNNQNNNINHSNSLEIVRYLITKGVPVDGTCTLRGLKVTPLHLASYHGIEMEIEIERLL